MLRTLQLNISGLRGVWGQNLTENTVSGWAYSFALFVKENTKKENPTILLGRDGRESGPAIKKAIIEKLLPLGINIIDGDILPTPTVLLSVRENSYDGGIIITASHNPIEYNGLKFVNKNGLFTTADEIERIKYFNENKNEEKALKRGMVLERHDLAEKHIDHILSFIDIDLIKQKKFKVLADMINASASIIDPYLFEKLNIEFIPLNGNPNGLFAHKPEPLKENLVDVSRIAKEKNIDVGFVHDPDADRLVIIDENGEILSEEYTLALCIENILQKNHKKNVVVNLSTSLLDQDITEKYEGNLFRSKIGEGNVVEKIIEKNAIIGGEGNGGVIYPKINICRDGFVGIILILELMAERNKKISDLIKDFPLYYIKKDKYHIENKNMEDICTALEGHWENTQIDKIDGIRVDFPDKSWIQIRASNTEPIIRLIGEAKSEQRIQELFEETRLTLGLK